MKDRNYDIAGAAVIVALMLGASFSRRDYFIGIAFNVAMWIALRRAGRSYRRSRVMFRWDTQWFLVSERMCPF